MLDTEDSLLLLRVRNAAANSSNSDLLDLEVEAQLNYHSIYLAGPAQLDMKQLGATETAANNEYGRLLGQALGTTCAVQNALKDANRGARLRIQLMTQDCQNLPLIYWERMELPGWYSPAGVDNLTPFSRFAAVNQGLVFAPQDRMFRLVLALADPLDGLEPIDVGAHCASVVESCLDLLKSKLMSISILPGLKGLTEAERQRVSVEGVTIIKDKPTTAQTINDLLAGNPHGLHLIAHGTYNPKKGFYLLLESDDGHLHSCNATDLIETWNPKQLKFMFLESCQSACQDERNPRPYLHSFMQQLICAGLPGVLAMQDKIRMDDARTFTQGFYNSLVRNGSLDEAANSARRLLLHTPDYAWAIPAVMTRLKGAAIWRESALRNAQRYLQAKIERDHQDEHSYPRFPLDAIYVSGESILKLAAGRENDELVKVPLGAHHVRDLYLSLYESLLRDRQTTCILGPYGSAKSRVLEDVFLSEFQNHIEEQQKALPVLVRLSDCAHVVDEPKKVVALAIRSYFDEASQAAIKVDDLIELFRTEPFLFLVSADDNLGEAEQQHGLRLLKEFQAVMAAEAPQQPHRYLFTLDQNLVRVADLPDNAHYLFIQPMRAERVCHYLQAPLDKPDSTTRATRAQVLEKLQNSALFDLAEHPWLLAEMLSQAQRSLLQKNTGREAILGRICNERVAKFAGSSGMRSRVEEVLYRIAWELQSQRIPVLGGGDVFEVLAELRGNRDYSLTEFRTQLIDSCHIMASCGEDGMRFAYPAFQAYCCARYILGRPAKERDTLLTDITATLGRRARVEWWAQTLYLIAGRWQNTESLLSMILSGSPLHEGDQLYIAARCLHEARLASEKPIPITSTTRSIISALMYRSHPANGPSVASRIKALEYLGPLREPSTVPHLVSIVLDKIRPTKEGLAYELSGGRLAAIKALLYTQNETLCYLHTDEKWKGNVDLLKTVENWVSFDTKQLTEDLKSCDESRASVAAFALGLLKPISALTALHDRFFQSDCQSAPLLWSLADSMLELGNQDLKDVVSQAMSPDRPDRWIFGIYLIGKLGTSYANRMPESQWKFLWQHCADQTTLESPMQARRLKGRCLQTLAELNQTGLLGRCHDWLRGNDSTLCFYSLEALRHVGDESSLTELEALSFPLENAGDNHLLERLRLDVYEDLYWRLAGGLSREVMIPVSAPPEPSAVAMYATAS